MRAALSLGAMRAQGAGGERDMYTPEHVDNYVAGAAFHRYFVACVPGQWGLTFKLSRIVR